MFPSETPYLMNNLFRLFSVLGIGLLAGNTFAQDADKLYKVLDTTQVMGSGGIDYVFADSDGSTALMCRAGDRRSLI